MYVTFNNRFEIHNSYEGRQRVHYTPGLSAPVKLYIQPIKPHTDPSRPPPEQDWEIIIENSNQMIAEEIKRKLATELAWYLKRRTKREAAEITYKEIARLASVRSVS